MSRFLNHFRLVTLLVLSMGLSLACAGLENGEDTGPDTLGLSYPTKADDGSLVSKMERVKSDLYKDIRKIPDWAFNKLMDEITGRQVDLVKESFNLDLASGRFKAYVTTPELFESKQDPSGEWIGDLDKLAGYVSTKYGDGSLVGEVNRIRRQYLQQSGNEVFAEASLRYELNYGKQWSIDNWGFENPTNGQRVIPYIGLHRDAKREARIILAFGDKLKALSVPILKAMYEGRHFILPTGLDDLKNLEPGELVAIKGNGNLSFHAGLGVPIFIAEPTAWLTYRLVLSYVTQAVVEGELDVQMIRTGKGAIPGKFYADEVVVDVGVTGGTLLRNGFVLRDSIDANDVLVNSGLIDKPIKLDILGNEVFNLDKLVDKAIEDNVQDHLSLVDQEFQDDKNLISGEWIDHTKAYRNSLVRFRFDLDTTDKKVKAAFKQAVVGDVRAAQLLVARGVPGVVCEYDFSRSGASHASKMGIEIFGMAFYHHEFEEQQLDVLQWQDTEGEDVRYGVTSLLRESFEEKSGAFFSRTGYKVTGTAGMIFDITDSADPTAPRGLVNLLFELSNQHQIMNMDKMLDHLDGMILALGGPEALAAIQGPADAIWQYIHGEDDDGYKICPFVSTDMTSDQTLDNLDPSDRPCLLDVIQSATVDNLRRQAMTDLENATTGLEPKHRELVLALGRVYLARSATWEYPLTLMSRLWGPPSRVETAIRLDQQAINTLTDPMQRLGIDLEQAILEYMLAAERDRLENSRMRQDDREWAIRNRIGSPLARIGSTFDSYASLYRSVQSKEQGALDTVGPIGNVAMHIVLPLAGVVSKFNWDTMTMEKTEIPYDPSHPQPNADWRVKYENASLESLPTARARVLMEMLDQLIELAKPLTRLDVQWNPQQERSCIVGFDEPGQCQDAVLSFQYRHAQDIIGYGLLAMLNRKPNVREDRPVIDSSRADVRMHVKMELDEQSNVNDVFSTYRLAACGSVNANRDCANVDMTAVGSQVKRMPAGVFTAKQKGAIEPDLPVDE